MMRLDIFRRKDNEGVFTYLVVPEGRVIPEEASATDWEISDRGLEIDETSDELNALFIRDPGEQLKEKGYAISSILHTGLEGSGSLKSRH